MGGFLLRRLGQSIAVLFVVTLVIFILPRLVGSPANIMLPPTATGEEVKALEELMGLDKPLPTQFLIFIQNALQGDFGESTSYRVPAIEAVMERFPVDLKLAGAALLLVIPLGFIGGVLSALRLNGAADVGIRSFALVFQSLPNFWMGLMMVYIFSVQLGWLPTAGVGTWQHYVLPAITACTFPLVALLRVTRTSVLEIMDSEYIEFARAKGLSERKVIWKHMLRNALIAPVTYLGFAMATLLAGSVVVETVFAMPGIGYMSVQAVHSFDYAVVQTVVLLMAVIHVALNLIVDLTYHLIDPRIDRAT